MLLLPSTRLALARSLLPPRPVLPALPLITLVTSWQQGLSPGLPATPNHPVISLNPVPVPSQPVQAVSLLTAIPPLPVPIPLLSEQELPRLAVPSLLTAVPSPLLPVPLPS